MQKLKYAGLCAAGFFVNCVFLGTFFGIYGSNLDLGIKFNLFTFTGFQAIAIVSMLHAVFRALISKNLQKKTVVYTLLANVLPIVLGIAIRMLIFFEAIQTDGFYNKLEWLLLSHFFSAEMFLCGLLGFIFRKTILEKI